MDTLQSRSSFDSEEHETRTSVNEGTRRGLPPKTASSYPLLHAKHHIWLASLAEQTITSLSWPAKSDYSDQQHTSISARSLRSCKDLYFHPLSNGRLFHSICNPRLHQCLLESTEVLRTLLRAIILWIQAIFSLRFLWLQIRVRLDLGSLHNIRMRMASKGEQQKRRPSHSSSQKPKGDGNPKKYNDGRDRPGGSKRSEAKSGDAEGKPIART